MGLFKGPHMQFPLEAVIELRKSIKKALSYIFTFTLVKLCCKLQIYPLNCVDKIFISINYYLKPQRAKFKVSSENIQNKIQNQKTGKIVKLKTNKMIFSPVLN